MSLDNLLDYLSKAIPWAYKLFSILGGIVTLGTAIDTIIPDEKDHGFMKKIMSTPVLGVILKSLARFSPFNVRR